jgi:hypothetical protein
MATKEEHEQNGTAKSAEEPPPFPLTERDKWLLSLSDAEFASHIHTWDGLKKIIGKEVFIFGGIFPIEAQVWPQNCEPIFRIYTFPESNTMITISKKQTPSKNSFASPQISAAT